MEFKIITTWDELKINLIDKYIEFCSKLNSIKIKNNDFKLSIEYL